MREPCEINEMILAALFGAAKLKSKGAPERQRQMMNGMLTALLWASGVDGHISDALVTMLRTEATDEQLKFLESARLACIEAGDFESFEGLEL